MQKQEIIKKYPEQEDKLLVSKLLDKIIEMNIGMIKLSKVRVCKFPV